MTSRSPKPRSTSRAAHAAAAPVPATRTRRGAAATRAAILEAARERFAQAGYDHVGVREIAADAGVTAALVNRYFGSKAGLFGEVLASSFQLGSLAADDRARLGEAFAAYVAAASPGRGASTRAKLPLILRSATSPEAAAMLRDNLDERTIAPLAATLGGRDAELRAALIISLVLGIGVLRRVLRSRAFSRAADDTALQRLLAPLIQSLADDPR